MEIVHFENDQRTYYVNADEFPSGIQKAHQILHEKVPFSPGRNYFGVSWYGENGEIVYCAAATETEKDELASSGLPVMIIPGGDYLSEMVHDFMANIGEISAAISRLKADPRIDPKTFCVELYTPGGHCRCMVKMK